jgi:AdoMet-dependent heme synthase
LAPTGRGKNMLDISPQMYEDILRKVLSYPPDALEVKPTCAPQFMRIAKEMDVDMSRWSRGCIAGIRYCRILPEGSVTPCPYLPVKVGNIRQVSFKDIWANSEVLNELRDFDNLEGKCGLCEHRSICGGCRARAYGLTSYCGGAGISKQEITNKGNFLAEDPWCTYQPK